MKNDSSDLTHKTKWKLREAFCPGLARFQREPFLAFDVMKDVRWITDWMQFDGNLIIWWIFQSIAGKESWHLASMDMTINATRFAVFDLQKGTAYCFRVRSVNKYGISEPSEPSQPVSLREALGESEL